MAVVLPVPPTWLQNGSYSARMDRSILDVIFTEGVIGNAFEVTAQSPASLSVDIGVGRAIVTGSDQPYQGKYLVTLESSISIVLPPSPSSGTRIDMVVLEVNDPTAGGPAGDNAVIDVRTLAPLTSTGIVLAQIARTVGQTTIQAADITDVRPISSTNSFTVDSSFEILTQAEIDALTPFAGQTVYNSTLAVVQYYDGSVWQTVEVRAVEDRDQIIASQVFS